MRGRRGASAGKRRNNEMEGGWKTYRQEFGTLRPTIPGRTRKPSDFLAMHNYRVGRRASSHMLEREISITKK